ncbi:MAG: hypothetical protein CVU39_24335 [Chloroflexi bacterium HGW-Chloroflexi-10]|nr:MAG: hypothetical protein CVU39_24335 [Chloroflexi bacterium HGW-Chloroflexi-10]
MYPVTNDKQPGLNGWVGIQGRLSPVVSSLLPVLYRKNQENQGKLRKKAQISSLMMRLFMQK